MTASLPNAEVRMRQRAATVCKQIAQTFESEAVVGAEEDGTEPHINRALLNAAAFRQCEADIGELPLSISPSAKRRTQVSP